MDGYVCKKQLWLLDGVYHTSLGRTLAPLPVGKNMRRDTHTHTSMQPISRLPSHTHHLNRPTPPTHPQPFAAYAPLTTCPVAGPISPVAAALPTLDATAFLPVVVITPTPVSVAPVGPTGVWRKLGSPRGHVQCP